MYVWGGGFSVTFYCMAGWLGQAGVGGTVIFVTGEMSEGMNEEFLPILFSSFLSW